MIGTFRFGSPNNKSINIHLVWSDGERSAQVNIPDFLSKEMGGEWPSVHNMMSAESALAYGIFIAARNELPLFLSGDRTVWNEAWGTVSSIQ